MTDLDKRLNRDVVVISNHLRQNLAFGERTYEKDATCALVVEPEIFTETLRQDVQTGASAVIVNAIQFHASSLRTSNSLSDAELLAINTCKTYECYRISHPLISVKQSNLPLDESCKNSLAEISNDYKFIGELFDNKPVDGFYLEGFTNSTHLKCALVGLRKSTDKTILIDASQLTLDENFNELDYFPCSKNVCALNFAELQSTDSLLSEAEKKVFKGCQFLTVISGKPAQTAGITALLQGTPL